MVFFYKDELMEIHNGHPSLDLFTINERRGLRRKGIIKRGPYSKHILTPEALAILKRIKEGVQEYLIDVKDDWERDYEK